MSEKEEHQKKKIAELESTIEEMHRAIVRSTKDEEKLYESIREEVITTRQQMSFMIKILESVAIQNNGRFTITDALMDKAKGSVNIEREDNLLLTVISVPVMKPELLVP